MQTVCLLELHCDNSQHQAEEVANFFQLYSQIWAHCNCCQNPEKLAMFAVWNNGCNPSVSVGVRNEEKTEKSDQEQEDVVEEQQKRRGK